MSSGARTGVIVAIVAIILIVGAFAFGLVDVSQTREASLPEVKAEGGQLPTFDVDTAKVEVGTKNATVEVPKVNVETQKESIPVPTVSVKKTSE